MIKVILYTALGYWIARQVYESIDLKKRKEQQDQTKRHLTYFLTQQGWSKAEIATALDETFGSS